MRSDRQFLIECEAKTLLEWPLQRRKDFLARAERRRGKPSIDVLKTEIIRQTAAKMAVMPLSARRSILAKMDRGPDKEAARALRIELERQLAGGLGEKPE